MTVPFSNDIFLISASGKQQHPWKHTDIWAARLYVIVRGRKYILYEILAVEKYFPFNFLQDEENYKWRQWLRANSVWDRTHTENFPLLDDMTWLYILRESECEKVFISSDWLWVREVESSLILDNIMNKLLNYAQDDSHELWIGEKLVVLFKFSAFAKYSIVWLG
jgi:hypothetical protein